jgi:hypothetical protein
VSTIYEALRDYFSSTGLDVDEHADAGWVATDGFGEHGSWLLVGQAHEVAGSLAIYSVLPSRIPEERRDAVALLLTRINYGLIVGNFELDLDDGEVRFKASGPTGTPLPPLVATVLGQTDRWLPALEAVAGGEDPASAFARGLA